MRSGSNLANLGDPRGDPGQSWSQKVKRVQRANEGESLAFADYGFRIQFIFTFTSKIFRQINI